MNLYEKTIETLDFKGIKDFGSNQDIKKLERVNNLVRFSTEYDHFNQCVVNLYRLP